MLANDLSAIGWLACTDLDAIRVAKEAVDGFLEQGELRPQRISALSAELIARSTTFSNGSFSTDPWEDLFGVPRSSLTDAAGLVVSSRLLAHYYQRPAELAKAAGALMFLARVPFMVSVQLGPTLVSLLETPNFLWTSRAMALIQERLSFLGMEPASAKIRAFSARGDQAWTSSRTFNAITNIVDSEADPRTRTALRLDAYRKLAEGQLRSWLWLLLDGGDTNERAPMLAGLSRRVSQDPRTLMRQVSVFLKPTWRNASAHEDIQFDEHDRMVDEDGTVVGPTEIERRTGEALAFTAGCEAGLANYPTMVEAPDERASAAVPRSFQIRRTYEWFGDNGLLVRSVDVSKGPLLRISVESISLNQIDPCFQALVECVMNGVKFEVAEISTGFSDSVFVVTAQSVDLATTVWKQARRLGFYQNPGSTFLPMHLDTRLRIERQPAALDAIAWLALNDCLHAFDTAQNFLDGRGSADDKTLELMRRQEVPLSDDVVIQKYIFRRLRVASRAFQLTRTMVAEKLSDYASQAATAIDWQLADSARSLRGAVPGFIYPGWMLDLRDRIPAPPPAPTLGVWDWNQPP
ncbi:hypothetical protein [Herbiconiux sp. VKM Ac-2851]|uniref:hypothetical protein n=1 Tax=Herbiconiux sp. VKM Ac-2851 TaxID=2739025 RepID=UPI00156380C4|nr:hypothetical protein [Herbiconiux sp. VKM Ac-2851]NQX33292.1 hypothetical protein [Herbiconiux sp. VKM Ac-2851]